MPENSTEPLTKESAEAAIRSAERFAVEHPCITGRRMVERLLPYVRAHAAALGAPQPQSADDLDLKMRTSEYGSGLASAAERYPEVDPHTFRMIAERGYLDGLRAASQASGGVPLTEDPRIRAVLLRLVAIKRHHDDAPCTKACVQSIFDEHDAIIKEFSVASCRRETRAGSAPLVSHWPPTATFIAYVAHCANAALCEAAGDAPSLPWDDQHTRASVLAGVEAIIADPDLTPEQSHENWCAFKRADGWVYGTVKDPIAKTHPCLVPYADLPEAQRAKDALFGAIVRAIGATISTAPAVVQSAESTEAGR